MRWIFLLLTGCALGDGGIRPRGEDAAVDAAAPTSDAGRMCIEGETAPCTTACGSTGTARCTGGRVGACASPAESCEGTDEDCDGAVDEGIADRMCTAACGGGVTRCVGGRFTECSGGTPSPETCDNTDEDCDGAIDNGLSRPCTTACGMGTQRCTAGLWGACDGPMARTESCDNTDEDCDGAIDERVTRTCTSACGTGNETCTAGSFGACSAPMPRMETCNRADDDCDGTIDDGFQIAIYDPVPMAELTAEHGACTGPGAPLDNCMSAARRWCLNRTGGCYTAGGAGHLQATPTGARVVCVGPRGDEHSATFAEVSAASSITVDASNVATRVAQSAVNRYCGSRGFAAGIGPTEHGGGSMTVTCLPAAIASTVSIPTSDLNARGCDPIAAPNGLNCSSAADNVCRARGYLSGYGPVEWNTTDSAVVCFIAS